SSQSESRHSESRQQRPPERDFNREPRRAGPRDQSNQPPRQTPPSQGRPPQDSRYQQNDAPLPRDVEAQLMVPLEKAYTGGRERIRLEDGRMIEVNLPKAIISGQKLRLKGQGIAGGNLFLQIDVAPHKFYKLNGLDLVTQVPVTPVEAVLAGPIEVPTIDGLVKMNLPKGLKSGQKLRLGKRGYPSPEGDRRGDQIVELVIQMPAELSDAEKELYEKLKQTETNPRANLV
ncbi:J domain-containing protein, partial [filamentous cyanobacterium LEGE 11480]